MLENRSTLQLNIQVMDVSGRLVSEPFIEPNTVKTIDGQLGTGYNLVRLYTLYATKTFKLIKP